MLIYLALNGKIYIKKIQDVTIILVLFVDNILFINSDFDLLYKTTKFLNQNFNMVDIIYRDIS